jgi:putative FmdB family regulatory protein
MPIYEYLCPKCNESHEEFFWSSTEADGHRPACPACGTVCELRLGMPRVITNPSWIGSGGRPINPVDRFKAAQERQAEQCKKYSGLDRRAARLEKEAWEKKHKPAG